MKVHSSAPATGQCGSGVLFMALDTGRFLFVKRSPDSYSPNTWCCPGGGVEDYETIEQAARREVSEEIGYSEPYDLVHIHRDVLPNGYVFHNHMAAVDHEFEPMLNHEHTDFRWSNTLPENLHPGLERSIEAWQGRQGVDS